MYKQIGCGLLIKLEIIGFHATSQENVNSIIEDKFKINKERCDEWLGYGIYLFKYKIDAITWGEGTYYCKPNPKVIKFYTKIEKDKYLDLDDPQKLNEYDEYYKKMLDNLSKHNKVLKFKSKYEAMCWGLNIYKKDNHIDAVKYTFENNRTKNAMKYKSNKLGYKYNETQICISNNDVVYKKELCS